MEKFIYYKAAILNLRSGKILIKMGGSKKDLEHNLSENNVDKDSYGNI